MSEASPGHAAGDRDALAGARIFLAGHRGMVGSAIERTLRAAGLPDPITRSRAELDLADGRAVDEFFADQRPDVVFLCAAKVGGIAANEAAPADFIRENLAIQTNTIDAAWRWGARRLVFFGSSCIYPRNCPQPIRESFLLTGPLEGTNRAYAVAKIAGVEMCHAYNRQHGARYLALMPCNLYGRGDDYDPETSHVLPALIRKCHEAKVAGLKRVDAWGTGRPRREFLCSDDLAAAAVHAVSLSDDALLDVIPAGEPPLLNVGAGRDIPVADLVTLVADVVGFGGRVEWDGSRPDGTPRKLLDVSRMAALGWRARVGLREGVRLAYDDYLARYG